MYVNNETEVLLEALTRNRRTRRPPGFNTKVALSKLEQRMAERIESLASSLRTSDAPISLFSVTEVAKMFGVSVRTIETLIADGDLVHIRVRSVRRISKESIEAYLRSSTGARRI